MLNFEIRVKSKIRVENCIKYLNSTRILFPHGFLNLFYNVYKIRWETNLLGKK